MTTSPSTSNCVLRITPLEEEAEDPYCICLSYSILLSSKITGLNPSVQQDTEVPSSFIQGKFPPNMSVITFLFMSFQAHWQNPSGILRFSLTMNSWPSLNLPHASIACPIGGLSPKICFESVLFKTVIFSLPFSTMRSPTSCLLADLLILTASSASKLVRRLTLPVVDEGVA